MKTLEYSHLVRGEAHQVILANISAMPMYNINYILCKVLIAYRKITREAIFQADNSDFLPSSVRFLKENKHI